MQIYGLYQLNVQKICSENMQKYAVLYAKHAEVYILHILHLYALPTLQAIIRQLSLELLLNQPSSQFRPEISVQSSTREASGNYGFLEFLQLQLLHFFWDSSSSLFLSLLCSTISCFADIVPFNAFSSSICIPFAWLQWHC